LFHHTPLENAVSILNSGNLLSRAGSEGVRKRDVADPQVISTTAAAYDSVRLYFRPRTPTQYHLEGIRKPADLFKPGVHAPVIFIFVFDALTVLSRAGTKVSDGNMQSSYTNVYDTEEEFYGLDFASIYHDGPFDSQAPSSRDIVRARCAETLTPSPLLIASGLQAVLCRSPAERATLLHLLHPSVRSKWSDQIRVAAEPGLFDNRFAFVKSVDASKERILFALNGRHDGQKIAFTLRVTCLSTGKVFSRGPVLLEGSKRYFAEHNNGEHRHRVEIWLEDVMAFCSEYEIADDPF
jgi:hypothetical protein